MSGQLTREQAFEELKTETYPVELQREDKEYVSKKFGLTLAEFDAILSLPIKSYADYPNNSFVFKNMRGVIQRVKKIATYNRSETPALSR